MGGATEEQRSIHPCTQTKMIISEKNDNLLELVSRSQLLTNKMYKMILELSNHKDSLLSQ